MQCVVFSVSYFFTAALAIRLPIRVTCSYSKLLGWLLQRECWRVALRQFQLLNQWEC